MSDQDAPEARTAPAHTGDPHKWELVMESIHRALKSIEYGSVLIKVHQGEVVSIETSIKHRLPGTSNHRPT